jgi:hypothetical protein
MLCRNGPAILIAADGSVVAIVITVTGQWTNLSHDLILAIRRSTLSRSWSRAAHDLSVVVQ